MGEWIRITRNHVASLRVVAFPFEAIPQDYAPQSTVFELEDGQRVHPYMWCYLERKTARFSELNSTSLSHLRIQAMPAVMARLSTRARFENARPQTVLSRFRCLTQFLTWADAAEHDGRFEQVFSDPNLALEALKGHHAYVRQMLQARQLDTRTAAKRDQSAIAILSEIHNYTFLDAIEPLTEYRSGGINTPLETEVGAWMSTLQAIFDSTAKIIQQEESFSYPKSAMQRVIRLSATDDSKTVVLRDRYPLARLMELACVTFAGLAIGDSGANLSQIQRYEKPDDLSQQLERPERLSLTQKVIKFRAGGKPVPVHLTSTTLSRINTYLHIRGRLLKLLDCPDVSSMFVQCAYKSIEGTHGLAPLAIKSLSNIFLTQLRSKCMAIGAELPQINLKQLRAYKQQHVVRKSGIKIAAETMGHSIFTAVSAYCKAQEEIRRSDMGNFLSSLSSTILPPSRKAEPTTKIISIPTGSCKNHGKPVAAEQAPIVKPDCKETGGCFFCSQFRIHADEQDIRKLLSCRHVLQRLGPLQGESASADRIFMSIKDRIEALLQELRIREPDICNEMQRDVDIRGNLTRYWAVRLQQLHLLGILSHPA